MLFACPSSSLLKVYSLQWGVQSYIRGITEQTVEVAKKIKKDLDDFAENEFGIKDDDPGLPANFDVKYQATLLATKECGRRNKHEGQENSVDQSGPISFPVHSVVNSSSLMILRGDSENAVTYIVRAVEISVKGKQEMREDV
ncbi:hypothetical protein E1B28_009583 [Marasmius oreades]|uniref:Uncharacterized protein n=1 Tax=Marasmius oreades TaxID=181124 RepID=A0A9P7UQL7_9AGAR|nr:uncharacterized protein E1B28_009583 [Marasmius oreades]KAG7090468.1 hypothetical protein E1B28_009583 [Marasmius oreades]